MREFPDYLTPEYKGSFEDVLFQTRLRLLRREIYNLVIKGDENQYFSIDTYARNRGISMKDMMRLIDIVSGELRDKGWKTKLSFGNTGLFIYSTKDPPRSCYTSDI